MQSQFLATIQEENESEISTLASTAVSTHESNSPNLVEDEINNSKMDSVISNYGDTFSYQCLKQIAMSSSSIYRDPYFYFPELEDPGIEAAWQFKEYEPVHDTTGLEMYIAKCKELYVVPIGRVVKNLDKKKLDLKFFYPSDKQMQALCTALTNNKHVEQLILQDNWLSADSVKNLSKLLEENKKIKKLILTECRIGPKNIEFLNDCLMISRVKELDLSYNSLGDEGLGAIADGLRNSLYLKKINLSHNDLTEAAARYLEEIFLTNDSIDDLNLSWNNLNTDKVLKRLCRALVNNKAIHKVNLSWNGISAVEAVVPLEHFLKRSKTIKCFDVSNNILKGAAMEIILNGAFSSRCLEEIKIGNNAFTPDEAQVYGSMFSRLQMRRLKVLDMENMTVNKSFLQIKNEIRKQEKDVVHGVILKNYVIRGPYVPKVLFERSRYLAMKPKKKKQRVDFGHFVLSLPEKPCSRQDFQDLLIKKKLHRLDIDLINSIQEYYTIKKVQKIDTSKLVADYMLLYPDTKLPPEKPKKPPKVKQGKAAKKQKAEKAIKQISQTETVEQTQSKNILPVGSSVRSEEPTDAQVKILLPSENVVTETEEVKISQSVPFAESKVKFSMDPQETKVLPDDQEEHLNTDLNQEVLKKERLSSSRVLFKLDDGDENKK